MLKHFGATITSCATRNGLAQFVFRSRNTFRDAAAGYLSPYSPAGARTHGKGVQFGSRTPRNRAFCLPGAYRRNKAPRTGPSRNTHLFDFAAIFWRPQEDSNFRPTV